MSEGAAKADIDKGITGGRPRRRAATAAPFFRFPGFADTPALVAELEARGYTVFGSDLWASDWSPMTPKAELDLVLSRLEKAGKGIVLFHDSQAHNGADAAGFPARAEKARGYAVVHIVPGDGPTPIAAAGPGWTSTTEPIIAKTLGPKAKPPQEHEQAPERGGAEDGDHTHRLGEP